MAQKFDARQTISRDVLSQLLGVSGTELDDLLRAINKEFNAPLRISASATPDAKINFTASEVEAADLAAKNASPVSSQIPTFVASTIDFQTGATTGGTFNITFPTSTVGYFRRIGFSLDASGTIQCLFSAEVASFGSLANPGTVFVKNALPIGWIDLEATASSPGRFKTAGSATNIIENKVSTTNRVHRIMGGGGSGTGSGSGTGDDINALTFKASFTDLFADLPTDSVSAVDYTAGKTDSTTYDIVNTYHRLAYDASKTVTGTGVNMVLSGTPAFTIKAGDMLVVGTQARKIASLTSQTVFAIESAFTTNPSAAAATVSQAVHSKDLNNFAGDGLAISTAFGTNISQILLIYEDTTAANDIIYDANTTPVIGFTASSDGTNFTGVTVRPTNLSDTQLLTDLPTSSTNLYLRLFANKASGSGSVNVLGYKAFFHRDTAAQDGLIQNQAYCFTNGSGSQINCLAPSVVSGKTRIQTNWTFPVDVNSGTTNGALQVTLNGQKIPRFVSASATPDASYKEIDQRTIELDADYSGLALSVEIMQTIAVVDASDPNTTNISQTQEMLGQGFQSFVNTAQRLNATTATGTPAAGSFYSTVVNRKTIPDLTADLGVRMGIERVMTQQMYQLQDEFGPNGESVWSIQNDDKGLIRLIGAWLSFNNSAGSGYYPSATTDYIEYTFYGTGMNLLCSSSNSAQDLKYAVDGGTESAFFSITPSGILNARNYASNMVLPVVSGLSLGVHTVKVRVNANLSTLGITGIEILNEVSSLRIQPGSSYIAGKKVTLSSQQTLVHNTTFESGTLGTRGGRVVVYQKADGTIAKAVQPTDAAQANLTSANHQNEEVSRTYHWREFGAGRADDFNTLINAASSRAFTLDDGTTTLIGQSAILYLTTEGVYPNGINDFLTFTFIGTGLDIRTGYSGSIDSTTVFVDGTSVGSVTSTVNGSILKIVSGLPYGTHTVKLLRTNNVVAALVIKQLIVYQSKKPTIPSGAIELADYNVMATYVANTVAGLETIGTGLLRKQNVRELVFVDGTGGTAWAVGALTPSSFINGLGFATSHVNSYVQNQFFGTGFDLRYQSASNRSTNILVTLNGLTLNTTNFPSLVATVYGGAGSFSTSTGILSQNSGGVINAGGFQVSGIPLGNYTLKFNNGTAGTFLVIDALDIITPIHSPKSNQYADLQNTLPIGSNAISDNRKTTPIKDTILQPKAWAQAVGVTLNPSTTASTPYVPVPDLSCTIKTNGGPLQVSFGLTAAINGANQLHAVIMVDGVQIGKVAEFDIPGVSSNVRITDLQIIPVAPGTHKVDIYWGGGSGTKTAFQDYRDLTVREL